MSKSREQLNAYLSSVNIEGKTVLDVGVQDKPTSRLTKGTPAKYYTLDIDPQWKPDFVGDLNEEMWLEEPTGPNTITWLHFDTIFCIETLEHCWNPIAVLRNLSKWLNDDGELYLSTPFINPHHDTWDFFRFTGEWYQKVLPIVGFKNVEVTERIATAGKGLLEAFYKAEGMKISKIRPEYGRYTYPVGYIIKATK